MQPWAAALNVVVMLIWHLPASAATQAAYLGPLQPPLTGQTTTLQLGDDGKLLAGRAWPETRFVDNDDGTLSDGLTGLMWIKDAFCANTSEYLSGATTGEWDRALNFATELNKDSLTRKCAGYTARYTDWHTPNINELSSLMRAEAAPITAWLTLPGQVNSSGFDNTGQFELAWSSTTVAGLPDRVWVADLYNGGIATAPKLSAANTYYVFSAVRVNDRSDVAKTGQTNTWAAGDDGATQRGRSAPAPRLISQNDGTVIDRATGLMWFREPGCLSPGAFWSAALGVVASLNASMPTTCTRYNATHKDWRAPNLFELQSLLDFGQAVPALPTSHPFNLGATPKMWSSTPGKVLPNTAWAVDFASGVFHGQNEMSATSGVWPVRGPVSYPDLDASPADDTTASEPHYFVTNVGTQDLRITDVRVATQDVTTKLYQSSTSFLTAGSTCAGKTLKKTEVCELKFQLDTNNRTRQAVFAVIASDALGIPEFAVQLKKEDPPLPPLDPSAGDYRCFIATAAFGSHLDPEVRQLRHFRDDVMRASPTGSALVTLYYASAPPIARYISVHPTARAVVRALLTPVAAATQTPLLTASVVTLLCLALLRRNSGATEHRTQRWRKGPITSRNSTA